MEALEHRSYHARFHLRPERPLHPDVRLVAITPDDREIIPERWPWPRDIHAQMLQLLAHCQAASIAWDIVFNKPLEPKGDEALKSVVAQTPRCCLAYLFWMEPSPAIAPSGQGLRLADFAIRPEQAGDKSLHAAAAIQPLMPGLELPGQLGFVNMIEEPGGVIIRMPLVLRCQGYIFPSLSLLAVCKYLDVKLSDVEVRPGRYVRLESAKRGRFTVPIDRQGRMLINFCGGASVLSASSERYTGVLASLVQIQSGEKPAVNLEQFKGKIVFVGATDPVLKDQGATPLEANFPKVGLLANIASSILERDFITRARHGTNRALLVILTLLTATAASWRPLKAGALFVAGMLAAFLVGAQIAFAWGGLWINVVAPSWSMVAAYCTVVTYRFFAEERERARTRRWLVRYLSPDIVEEALQTPENLVFTGATKKITVVLSDIRDFTPMTEALGPQAVVTALNEYFAVMTKVIHKHRGSVNQFVGDEILAVFGAPITRPDDAHRAVLTALEMATELDKLMAQWAASGRPTFNIGIAVNTGTVVVGNIGSLDHMDYAVMGDTINYAARLESLTKEYKTRILISESTCQEVKDKVVVESLGSIQVKGRRSAEPIYKLVGLKEEAPRAHSSE
jgi:adenylate cyclase